MTCLILHKVDLMNKVGSTYFFNTDNHVEGVGVAYVPSDGKLESAFRRTGVNNREIARRMFLEEIAEHEFGLCLTVHRHLAVEVHVDIGIEELNDLFGIAGL